MLAMVREIVTRWAWWWAEAWRRRGEFEGPAQFVGRMPVPWWMFQRFELARDRWVSWQSRRWWRMTLTQWLYWPVRLGLDLGLLSLDEGIYYRDWRWARRWPWREPRSIWPVALTGHPPIPLRADWLRVGFLGTVARTWPGYVLAWLVSSIGWRRSVIPAEVSRW